MTEFTPGPWKAKEHPNFIEEGDHWGVTYQYDYGDSTSCTVWVVAPRLTEANARLIAAAPEGYAVIKAALHYIPEGTPTFEDAQYYLALIDKETI